LDDLANHSHLISKQKESKKVEIEGKKNQCLLQLGELGHWVKKCTNDPQKKTNKRMVDYSRHEWLVSNRLKVQVKLRVPQETKKIYEWLNFSFTQN